MILVVSDWHLGYKKCNRDAILNFLDDQANTKIDHLILLGDIFDFWRRNNAEIIEENDDIMGKLDKLNVDTLHYIAGNHDYYVLDQNNRYEQDSLEWFQNI